MRDLLVKIGLAILFLVAVGLLVDRCKPPMAKAPVVKPVEPCPDCEPKPEPKKPRLPRPL